MIRPPIGLAGERTNDAHLRQLRFLDLRDDNRDVLAERSR
jgi:hypothetical protein